MAPVIYLDTHAVVFLAQDELHKLSARAKRLIERSPIRISPAVALELQFLFEIGKTRRHPSTFLDSLLKRLGGEVCDLAFNDIVKHAEVMSWTRDVFDRLITAQAALAKAPLLTKDTTIRAHYKRATW